MLNLQKITEIEIQNLRKIIIEEQNNLDLK